MRIGAKPWVYRWALRDVSICTELTWLREVLPPRVKGKQTNNNIFSFHIYDSDSIIPSSLCGYVAHVAWHDISFFNSFVFRCSFKSKLKCFNFNRFCSVEFEIKGTLTDSGTIQTWNQHDGWSKGQSDKHRMGRMGENKISVLYGNWCVSLIFNDSKIIIIIILIHLHPSSSSIIHHNPPSSIIVQPSPSPSPKVIFFINHSLSSVIIIIFNDICLAGKSTCVNDISLFLAMNITII